MSSKTIYTLGYGSRDIHEFITITHKYSIDIIIDVRRFPRSKNPYYNKDLLEKILMHQGIKYYWLGELLGGYRGGYTRYMETEQYKLGIEIMEKLVQQTIYSNTKAAIICLEKNPRGCHRKHIAETLENKGYTIIHIIEEDKTIRHREIISAGGGI